MAVDAGRLESLIKKKDEYSGLKVLISVMPVLETLQQQILGAEIPKDSMEELLVANKLFSSIEGVELNEGTECSSAKVLTALKALQATLIKIIQTWSMPRLAGLLKSNKTAMKNMRSLQISETCQMKSSS